MLKQCLQESFSHALVGVCKRISYHMSDWILITLIFKRLNFYPDLTLVCSMYTKCLLFSSYTLDLPFPTTLGHETRWPSPHLYPPKSSTGH